MAATPRSMGSDMQLSNLFKFTPLDRLQINDKRTIDDLSVFRRMYGINNPELPFVYFQRVLSDGKIEVRSPSGQGFSVDATDVCDVIKGEPVIVRAMTRQTFIARSSRPIEERHLGPTENDYQPAYVLWVSKNQYGQIEPRVLFLDEALNQERHNSNTWIAPVHIEDRFILESVAKRTIMPVSHYKSKANASADHGIERVKYNNDHLVKCFIQASIMNKNAAIDLLLSHEMQAVKVTKINQVMQR